MTVTCSGSTGSATAAPALLWQVDPNRASAYQGSEVRVHFKLVLGLDSSEIRVSCANSVATPF